MLIMIMVGLVGLTGWRAMRGYQRGRDDQWQQVWYLGYVGSLTLGLFLLYARVIGNPAGLLDAMAWLSIILVLLLGIKGFGYLLVMLATRQDDRKNHAS